MWVGAFQGGHPNEERNQRSRQVDALRPQSFASIAHLRHPHPRAQATQSLLPSLIYAIRTHSTMVTMSIVDQKAADAAARPEFAKQTSLSELERKQKTLAVPVESCKKRAAEADAAAEGVETDLKHLIEGIKRLGTPGVFEGSLTVTFGKLFDDDELANKLESMVGTLKAGRKRGVLAWEGQLLLKGKDDDAPITLNAATDHLPTDPTHHHNVECDAETLEQEKLERRKSVELVVAMQEQERARQLLEASKHEKHNLLARRASVEEAKEALEEEQQRRVSLSHPELKQVHSLVRKHTQGQINHQMEVERERRIAEGKAKDGTHMPPPKIDLSGVPVVN